MRSAIFILTLLIFTSCQSKKEVDTITNIKIDKVEGLWFEVLSKKDSLWMGNISGVEFIRDTFSELNSLGLLRIGPYKIENDTILIETEDSVLRYYFKVTTDTLFLSNSIEKRVFYNQVLDFNSSLTYDEIYIETGWCLGLCKQYKASLTNTGIINYLPGENCKLQGKHQFILTNQEINKIHSLFKESRFDKIDKKNYYGAVDDWEIKLSIISNGKKETVAGTFFHFPYQLRPLIFKLTSIIDKKDNLLIKSH